MTTEEKNGRKWKLLMVRHLYGAAYSASTMAIVAMNDGAIVCPAIRRIVGPVQPDAMTWEAGSLLRSDSREIETPIERGIRIAAIVGEETGLALYDDSSHRQTVRRLKARLMSIDSDELEVIMEILNENDELAYLFAQDLIVQATQLAVDDCRVITLSPAFDINGQWLPL